MITEEDIKWRCTSRISTTSGWQSLWRDNEHGIQYEEYTAKNWHGFPKGKPKRYFFIDNDDREFHSLDDMIEAYNEKFKFSEENPEHEVIYVKVIRKRIPVTPTEES